ncbi:hypothetical protein [Alteromonas lipolytica]|uniref:Lipoprotein n=1 Tax=Alteromonas lipolytica TaxID=1856405 RepID=A0A1E8FAP1_9ALTE|nr:hypothetical protein [Alteromonas lipolytica]OFI32994.1 hypothetical protein BFC17_01595 [Alteromonas lipolytica]GGF63491.1 hypothetical protein GCM10011338_14870 [Alteromonas lipolytica]
MHKYIPLPAILLLAACGGGGSSETSAPAPAPAPAGNAPAAQVGGGDVATVPASFDFSNFVQQTVSFSVPDDLSGQVNFKLTASWDDKIQDLYLGRSQAGEQISVTVNIPSIIDLVTIEYMAYDVATDTAQVKIMEVAL